MNWFTVANKRSTATFEHKRGHDRSVLVLDGGQEGIDCGEDGYLVGDGMVLVEGLIRDTCMTELEEEFDIVRRKDEI